MSTSIASALHWWALRKGEEKALVVEDDVEAYSGPVI